MHSFGEFLIIRGPYGIYEIKVRHYKTLQNQQIVKHSRCTLIAGI